MSNLSNNYMVMNLWLTILLDKGTTKVYRTSLLCCGEQTDL